MANLKNGSRSGEDVLVDYSQSNMIASVSEYEAAELRLLRAKSITTPRSLTQ